ncbi:energy transducer TonB [Aliivibrio sp. EL58]|uniref:energy transducer TonB n=1 Tax=Aliivibrio sp. EL58 TaxID=2107582 RepID=UPI000EFD5FEC|nr:energy transducer TonB [Aliivibrio sp. EL58]
MLRSLLALILAIVMTLALFSFMAWMTIQTKNSTATSATLQFDVIMTEPDSQSQRRIRQLPEPPKTPSAPQSQSKLSSQVSNVDIEKETTMPSVELGEIGLNVAVSLPSFEGLGQNQQAMPLYRVEPKYPSRALKRKMEGYVILRFTIDELGKPTDIESIEAEPSRVFVRPAIQALKQWKYQPKLVKGKAIIQPGQTVRLEYRLNP